LPDILIARSKGMPFGYHFPTSGTVVIDDAIGIVRGTKHRAEAEKFLEFVGSVEMQVYTAANHWRVPARDDLPVDEVPEWVADVQSRMVVAPMDWPLLGEQGAVWMRYWDQRGRGSGGTRWALSACSRFPSDSPRPRPCVTCRSMSARANWSPCWARVAVARQRYFA